MCHRRTRRMRQRPETGWNAAGPVILELPQAVCNRDGNPAGLEVREACAVQAEAATRNFYILQGSLDRMKKLGVVPWADAP